MRAVPLTQTIKLTTPALNADVLNCILDFVIDDLAPYHTKERIDTTYRLRLVCRTFDRRLAPTARKNLDVPTYEHLNRLFEAEIPNWRDHEWIRLCSYNGPKTAALLDLFMAGYLNSKCLGTLILDLYVDDYRDFHVQERLCFPTLPGSVKTLTVLHRVGTALMDDEVPAYCQFLDSFLSNGDHLKLAFHSIPAYRRSARPSGKGTFALFFGMRTEHYDFDYLGDLARKFPQGCDIRVILEDDPEWPESLLIFRRWLLRESSEKVVFEEIHVPAGSERKWFMNAVIDGTIWTPPSKPMTV